MRWGRFACPQWGQRIVVAAGERFQFARRLSRRADE
jgi:hypothetical protein